jgi:hypothetical protein
MGMNRDVYSYLLKTYGRESGYWAGFVLIIVQTLLLRVVAFLFIAHLAGNLATGNIDAAKRDRLRGICWLTEPKTKPTAVLSLIVTKEL